MNRLRARIFNAGLAFLLAIPAVAPVSVRAQAGAPTFWFAGTQLILDRPVPLNGDVAVSIRDSGLQRLLARTGATLAYQPQQRYVLVTTSDRRILSFTVGDARYAIAGIPGTAPFAPFYDGNDVIVPLLTIARALAIEPVVQGSETVLEPELGGLDVRADGRRTIVTLRGATALKYAKVSETPDRLQMSFSGIGSSLAAARRIGPGVDEVDVLVSGNPKNPTTTVTLSAPRGAQHLIASSVSPYEFTVVFGPPGVALDVRGGVAGPPVAYGGPSNPPPTSPPATPAPTAPPSYVQAPPAGTTVVSGQPQTGGPVTVTNVALEPLADGVNVHLALSGPATYDWHRLLDNRWYLDIQNATLSDAGRDEHPNSTAVDAVRVRQIGTPDAPVVRLAFTLHGSHRVSVTPDQTALTVNVGNDPQVDVARTGHGQIGVGTVAQTSVDVPPPGPPLAPIASPGENTWKFAPPPGPGGRVIVIDPGHGGADAGTAHSGLMEKILTLDISMRLRALLAQQGWNVKLTRDRDIDPISPATLAAYQTDGRPNPDDRAALQTRCDVANGSNARLFISVHVNYSDSPSVHGTTFYYSKPQDVPLAQALEHSMIPIAGTKDDGVVKSNLYVTRHATMPAVLIEAAFISNPGDLALLESPSALQNIAAGIAAGVKAYAGALPALSSDGAP